MLKAPLGIGLIGCGRIVQSVHLANLSRRPDVRVVALADPDPDRRERARLRVPSAAPFADYRGLLARPEVEAVVIAAPSALHAEMAIAALRAGKHVYLEKPLALGRDEGGAVVAAWEGTGLVGMIGYNYRFNPLHAALRRAIRSGRLGEPVAVRTVFTTIGHAPPDWMRSRRDGGGVLLDLASHHLDLLWFLFERPALEVGARLWSRRTEADTATVELRLAGGLPVQSFFSIDAVDEDRVEVYCRGGRLSVDRYRSFAVESVEAGREFGALCRLAHGLRGLGASRHALRKLRSPCHEPSYAAALGHFVDSIRDGRPASPDFRDGARGLTWIEAAEASASSGQVVALDDVAAGVAATAGSVRGPMT